MGVEQTDNIFFPIELFSQREIGLLESLVEYLKEHQNMTYHEIAVMLNRNDRTIWTAYKQAKRKRGKA